MRTAGNHKHRSMDHKVANLQLTERMKRFVEYYISEAAFSMRKAAAMAGVSETHANNIWNHNPRAKQYAADLTAERRRKR